MKRILLIWTILATCLTMMAGNVTEQEALNIARQFLQGKLLQQQKQLRRAASAGDTPFYVFNVEQQGGFVIVSADDRTIPILGYADNGNLEMDKLPENARYWLESYAAQIKALGSNVKTTQAPRRVVGSPVTPLLTCHWDQGEPYNHRCDFYGGYCMTGCVATAMAQVMYYHKWPQAATPTIPAYTTPKYLGVGELAPTVFKWDKMKDTYSANETGESADAVAELMRYCGQAVEMYYGLNESSASVYASVMTHYFGYSQTARNVTRTNYTSLEWEKLIYQEVANQRPVIYSGQSGDVGHQFVIDGYDNQGLFHVNWGWSGASDGYFSLSVLNPYNRGIGGGSSENGFTMEQDAIIGLQPDQGQAAVTTLYCRSPYGFNSTYTRNSSSEDFQISLYASLVDFGIWNVSYDHKWVLYKDGEPVKDLTIQSGISLEISSHYNNYHFSEFSSTLAFGAGLADGIYELRQMTSTPNADQWQLCQYLNNDYLLAEISGNTLTLKYTSEIEDAIQINQVTVSEKIKEKRPATVLINWTNKGYQRETPFFVSLGGDFMGAASSFVEHGETGEVEIVFTNKWTGNQTLKISTDKSGNNVIYEQEVTVIARQPQNLTVDIAIEGENAGAIQGSTINATFTFTNEGPNDYDDDVEIYLFPLSHDSYSFAGDPIMVTKPLKVAAGAKADVNVQFPNLSVGNYYLEAYYYGLDLSWAGSTMCAVGLLPQKLSGSIQIEGAVGETIEGTTINATVNFTNNGSNDYDDEVLVSLYQFNESGTDFVGDAVEVIKPLKLAAGAQGSVTVQFPDLIAGRTYYLVAYYYAPSRTQAASATCTVGKVVYPVTLEIQATVANGTMTGAVTSSVEGTTAKLNLTLKNTSTYDFDDQVMLYIYNMTAGGNPQYVKEQHFTIQIPAGQTKVVENYEITDLEIDKRYFAQVYYNTGGNYEWACYTPYFDMVNSSGTDPDPDPVSTNSPKDEVTLMITYINYKELGIHEIEGTTAKMDIRLTNKANATHHFRLDVETYEQNADYTYTKVKTDYINVENLKAEESRVINHEITGLEIGKTYRTMMYFFTPVYDSQQINDGTINFKMVTPTGIQTVTSDLSSDSPAYNLNGQRVTSDHKGLIIRNGKKYVRK